MTETSQHIDEFGWSDEMPPRQSHVSEPHPYAPIWEIVPWAVRRAVSDLIAARERVERICHMPPDACLSFTSSELLSGQSEDRRLARITSLPGNIVHHVKRLLAMRRR